MYCRKCGDRVPTGAEICPGCGALTGVGNKKSVLSRWWFWMIIVCLVAAGVFMMSAVVNGAYTEFTESRSAVSGWEDDFEEDEVIQYEDPGASRSDSLTDVELAETVIFDEGGITVTTKGYEDTGYSIEIKLLVENNSGRDVTLSSESLIVNGVTIPSSMYITVKDGKKINDTISIYEDLLELAGINNIAALSTNDGCILDPESFERIGDLTFEIKTSIADSYVQEIDDSGEVLYDEGGVTIVYQRMMETSIGKSAILFVKNNSGRDLLIQSRDVSVNDYMVSGLMSDTVCDGTVSYCELLLFPDDLEENGIKTIENLAFVLKLIDPITFDDLKQTQELQAVISG